MKASVKQYAQVLFDLSQNKNEAELSLVIKNFSQLLIKDNQLAKLDRIIANFLTLWNKANSVIGAEIVSARTLTEIVVTSLEEYIREASRAEEIETKIKEDDKIIGGVIIKYADNILDASLKTRLEQLARKIKN